MILHKTGSLSPWLFTKQMARRFTIQVRVCIYKEKKKPFFSICRVLSVFVPEQLTPLPTLMASALTAHII